MHQPSANHDVPCRSQVERNVPRGEKLISMAVLSGISARTAAVLASRTWTLQKKGESQRPTDPPGSTRPTHPVAEAEAK